MHLYRLPMPFFSSWLIVSQGSEILVHLSAESCVMQHSLLTTFLCHAFFPFLMWFPILHVLSELDTWNIISQPDWTPYIQPLMPSSGNYPHTAWCIVAVGQWYKENVSCRWTVLQVVLHIWAVKRYGVSHTDINACLMYITYVRHSLTTVTLQLSGKFLMTSWVWMTHKNMGQLLSVKSVHQLCKQEM